METLQIPRSSCWERQSSAFVFAKLAFKITRFDGNSFSDVKVY